MKPVEGLMVKFHVSVVAKAWDSGYCGASCLVMTSCLSSGWCPFVALLLRGVELEGSRICGVSRMGFWLMKTPASEDALVACPDPDPDS